MTKSVRALQTAINTRPVSRLVPNYYVTVIAIKVTLGVLPPNASFAGSRDVRNNWIRPCTEILEIILGIECSIDVRDTG